MASPARSSVSPNTHSDPGYPSFNQSYPSDWKPSRPRLDPDITHRGRSEPVRVRTKPLQHPSGGPINSFPWTTDHPLVQANLTKARFEEPETSINAQDWPTYFNLDEINAQNARRQYTGPTTTAVSGKTGGFKRAMIPGSAGASPSFENLRPTIDRNAWEVSSAPTQPEPQSKAIIGTAKVDYGAAPGGIEATFYQEMMRSLGNVSVQDYAAQQAINSGLSLPRNSAAVYQDREIHQLTQSNPQPNFDGLDNPLRKPSVMPTHGGLQRSTDRNRRIESLISAYHQHYDFVPYGPIRRQLAVESPIEASNVLRVRLDAGSTADDYFPQRTPEHDAFRHIYASYRVARDLGPEVAKKWGDANERGNRHRYETIFIDLHNNKIGREIAQIPGISNEAAARLIEKAIKNSAQGKQSPVILHLPESVTHLLGRRTQPTKLSLNKR